MKTQKQIILEHLQKYGNISTMESFIKYYITDLQHAIMLLRKEGYNITDEWVLPKQNGYARKFKRYYLVEGD